MVISLCLSLFLVFGDLITSFPKYSTDLLDNYRCFPKWPYYETNYSLFFFFWTHSPHCVLPSDFSVYCCSLHMVLPFRFTLSWMIFHFWIPSVLSQISTHLKNILQ